MSEELTASFKGEPQAVHVLCYGITPDDHEWLQAHADDVEACAEYLHDARDRVRAGAPVLRRRGAAARRATAAAWRSSSPSGRRATARARRELNAPAAIYIETHGGTGVGGSDDHAGIDIGRTFTETPGRAHPARVPRPRARGPRRARTATRAAPPSGRTPRWRWPSARWAAATATGRPTRAPCWPWSSGSIARGRRPRAARSAPTSAPTTRARCCARGWRRSSCTLGERELLALLQAEGFSHADLYRRARRAHERRLRGAVRRRAAPRRRPAATSAPPRLGLFDGLRRRRSPTRPPPPSSGARRASSSTRDDEPARVALVADAVGGMHGVTHTLDEIRERGVPGLRGRGDRHRPQRRPPPARSPRSTSPSTRA